MVNQGKRFLALLRGINVGGNNIIAKDDLKKCFENLGLGSVHTYIQSGNVVFRSDSTNVKKLTAEIEQALSKQFQYAAQAVVLSHRQYKSELQSAPENWGMDETRKHNAMFMLGNLKPAQVMDQLPAPIEKYEQVQIGKRAIFWSASKTNLGNTTIMKLGTMPVYKQMTVRNHNTTFKLLTLLEQL